MIVTMRSRWGYRLQFQGLLFKEDVSELVTAVTKFTEQNLSRFLAGSSIRINKVGPRARSTRNRSPIMKLPIMTLSVLAYTLLAMACICYAELVLL